MIIAFCLVATFVTAVFGYIGSYVWFLHQFLQSLVPLVTAELSSFYSVWFLSFLQCLVPTLGPTEFGSIGYHRVWFLWLLKSLVPLVPMFGSFISSHRFWSQWLLQSLAPVLVPAEFGSLIKSYSVCFHCVLQSLGSLVSTEFWFHWLQRSLVPVLVSTEFGSMGSCGCLLHNFLQSFCVHWIQLNLVPILAPTEFGSAITSCRGWFL